MSRAAGQIVTMFIASALAELLGCESPNLGCDYTIPQCVAVCGGPAVNNLAGNQCTCPPGTFFQRTCDAGGDDANGDASSAD
jgi:hypothetical protein